MVPLIQIFDRTVSIYMIVSLIGVLICLWTAFRLAKNNGMDEIEMLFMSLFAFAAVVIGGALMYGITQFDSMVLFFRNLFTMNFASLDDFLTQAKTVFGGSVFYGGMIGAILTVKLYCKKKKLSSSYLDVAAICFPLFHFFGRIGCFLGGCCYGIECNTAFAVIISERALFPVQLLEASANLLLFIVLLIFVRKQVGPGCQITTYLVGYASIRFICEFFRDDPERGIWGILSTSQIISIIIFLAVAFRFTGIRSGKRNRKQTLPDHAPSSSGRKPH